MEFFWVSECNKVIIVAYVMFTHVATIQYYR